MVLGPATGSVTCMVDLSVRDFMFAFPVEGFRAEPVGSSFARWIDFLPRCCNSGPVTSDGCNQ